MEDMHPGVNSSFYVQISLLTLLQNELETYGRISTSTIHITHSTSSSVFYQPPRLIHVRFLYFLTLFSFEFIFPLYPLFDNVLYWFRLSTFVPYDPILRLFCYDIELNFFLVCFPLLSIRQLYYETNFLLTYLCSRLCLYRLSYSDFASDSLVRFFFSRKCVYFLQTLNHQCVDYILCILREMSSKMRKLRLTDSSLAVMRMIEVGLRENFEKLQVFESSLTYIFRTSNSIMFPAHHHDILFILDFLFDIFVQSNNGLFTILFYEQTLIDSISIFKPHTVLFKSLLLPDDPHAQHSELSSRITPVIRSSPSRLPKAGISTREDLPQASFNVFYATMSLPRQIDEERDLECEITFDSTIEDDDEHIFYPIEGESSLMTFGAYKRVGRKIHPVSRAFPEDCYVQRQIPEDPLLSLPPLPTCPPEFTPTQKITEERKKILNVNAKGFLLPEEEKLFLWIMTTNEDAIAFEDAERGTFKESYFAPYIIPTIPHMPWVHKHHPIAPGLLPRVMEVLKLKIAAGVYEQSQSSYRSSWFVVEKKNGKLRIVHDLQPLNAVTIRDTGTLPIVDDFVEGFAGRQCYTVFDLFWGFDARKIHPKSRDLTAFSTPLGLLQITSLPTGYTNSPAEFQKCMSMILQDEIPHTANIFIDDLPIKGPKSLYLDKEGNPETIPENSGIRRFIWEHAQDVHRIMHKVACAGATFAANKCQICLPEVLIIGQTCNAEGRSPDAAKVKKVLTWPQLSTPKEVRQFLGLCGTVRIWIPNYSKIVKPLSELYHIGKPFVWDLRRQDAFDVIKKFITSAPALRPIDYQSENPVILSVDSSFEATGMILSQIDEENRRRPARYGSLPMSPRESRYSQPKLELFGLYKALRHWRIYIISVKTLHVEVDAQYIKGMLNEPDLQPNAAINRWIQGILMFHFKLIHVPAEKHKGPDALSRRPLAEGEIAEDDDDSWLDNIALLSLISNHQFPPFPIHESHSPTSYAITIAQITKSSPICYASRISQENQLQDIFQFLSTLETPVIENVQTKRRFLSKAMEFFIKDGRLFKRNGNRPPLLVILEPRQKNSILLHAHENLGHKGIQAVYEVIRNRFFWPHMRADVYHHVKSCHECQIRSLKRIEVPLHVSTPSILFAKIYIDVMHMPLAKGYRCIVAAKDDLSGTCEARPLRNATAKSLASFFWEQIYCRYGAPIQVVTDNGPEVKEAFAKLLKRMGIPQVKISPYNHHANGVVERGHFILREAIIKACRNKITEWPEHVAGMVFADRVTVSRVTGFSPFQLLHGTDPILPLDLAEATFLVEGFRNGMSTEELLVLRARQLAKHPEDIRKAAETLKKARFNSKDQFEKRFQHRMSRTQYKAGELVLVRNTAIEMSHDRKHKPRYLGPYVVRRVTAGGNYKLNELDGAPLNYTYAAFRLLPYITRTHPFMKNNTEDADSGTESESSGINSIHTSDTESDD